MSRRGFLKGLLGLTLLPLTGRAGAQASNRRLILQTSPVAGFQYYDGERLFSELAEGDLLELRREPDNRYDRKAVEVYWKGRKLGYLPRVENYSISQMLDRGERLACRVTELGNGPSPRGRVKIEVSMLLSLSC